MHGPPRRSQSRSGDVDVVVVVAAGIDGEDDVDGVEDAGEVAEDGEQHADPELHGAAAVAEADAEGREEDGAQELQAPAAARAQPHLVLLLRPRAGGDRIAD
uniref:Uncharacterized protein n=1 Tax=Arundo donax TaxID=35708 RepID=A0A0A9G3E1_ARUDO